MKFRLANLIEKDSQPVWAISNCVIYSSCFFLLFWGHLKQYRANSGNHTAASEIRGHFAKEVDLQLPLNSKAEFLCTEENT